MGLGVYTQYLFKNNYKEMSVFVFCYKQHSMMFFPSCSFNESIICIKKVYLVYFFNPNS